MSNLFHNRLGVTLSSNDVAQIAASLEAIEQRLPFLVGLTAKELERARIIKRKNKVFVESTIAYAELSPEFMPAYIDVADLAQDFELHKQMWDIEGKLKLLLNAVTDTRILSGSEAFRKSLLYYKSTKSAAASGAPGAQDIADSLSEFFKRGPYSKVEEEEAAE